MIAVPSMLMVIPRGSTKEAISSCMPRPSMAVCRFSGRVAPEEEVENATNAFYEAIRNNMFQIDKRGTAGVLAALAFTLFNLFTIPCVAAVGVLRKEIGGRRLFWMAVVYQLAFSYGAAVVVYRLGLLIAGAGGFDIWTISSILYLLVIFYIIFIRKAPSASEVKEERISFTKID